MKKSYRVIMDTGIPTALKVHPGITTLRHAYRIVRHVLDEINPTSHVELSIQDETNGRIIGTYRGLNIKNVIFNKPNKEIH